MIMVEAVLCRWKFEYVVVLLLFLNDENGPVTADIQEFSKVVGRSTQPVQKS